MKDYPKRRIRLVVIHSKGRIEQVNVFYRGVAIQRFKPSEDGNVYLKRVNDRKFNRVIKLSTVRRKLRRRRVK
ncbi:hypothetical protein [Clostridium perfringens]|uniref:hypothetical protein n=1 Tax=Clostridium perfringens TaxID=1502 RepID=UPI0024BCF268|nr:hypothetical protein [Clostridium perfringens]